MMTMNDSGKFQIVESNYSGRLSHVSSQSVRIPISQSLLSRDQRLPLDTWNREYRRTFFANQFSTFDSTRDLPERILSEHANEAGQNYGTIPMLVFATKLMTTIS